MVSEAEEKCRQQSRQIDEGTSGFEVQGASCASGVYVSVRVAKS
jgi:hypothetical protein